MLFGRGVKKVQREDEMLGSEMMVQPGDLLDRERDKAENSVQER